jgi:hypothetical protein
MARVSRDSRRLNLFKWRKVRAPRARCQVTPGKRELTESATENRLPN